MATKTYKPVTPSRRYITVVREDGLYKGKPEKSLTKFHHSATGRNHYGRLTTRTKGGGHKRKYRIIDFKRDKDNIPAKVHSIQYDPNRSANIALLHYADGEKRYILAPVGLKPGDTVISGPACEIRPGNCMELRNIPVGTLIHNIELRPGKGGQLVRSAGAAAQLMAKEGNYAQIRLPSGEVRMVLAVCRATIGQVGNVEHENEVIGKAGRSRWLGIRPKVRGVAKNPVDHPMGGGEGRTSGGRHPCTPWGKPTKGLKTRRNKATDKYIIKRRDK